MAFQAQKDSGAFEKWPLDLLNFHPDYWPKKLRGIYLLVVFSNLKIFQTKVKNDHRSQFSNLSNWKEEA